MSRYQLLFVAEVAARLKRNRWFVYKEIEAGHIATCQIGGRAAILQSDLDAYVIRNRKPARGERKSKIVFEEAPAK